MGSMLETIKKGISALNPLGTSTKPAPKTPIKSVEKKGGGYLGGATDKIKERNKAPADAMKE